MIELELSNDQAKLVALKDLFVDERYDQFHIVSLINYPSGSQGFHHLWFLQMRPVYLVQSDQYSSTSSIKRAFTRFPLAMNLPIRVAARSFRKDSLEAPTHLGLLVPPWTVAVASTVRVGPHNRGFSTFTNQLVDPN